jgi:hypothetical protein
MKYLAFICFLFVAFSASADDRHYQLAMEFESLSSSKNKSALVNSIVQPLIKYKPELTKYKEELRERILNLLNSKKYREGKIKVYIDLFTESELEKLITMVQSPTYKLLLDRQHEMNKRLGENAMKLYIAESKKLLSEVNEVDE